MIRCLYKVVLHIVFFFVIAAGSVYGFTDSIRLPASLQQQLNKAKQRNDLESWIYARIAWVEEKPAERMSYLMRTQQEIWRSYNTYDERLVWFDLLALQGYYQLQTGNILSSISAYESALAFYESYPLPDVDVIETVLKPLGNNYTRLADYQTALFIHQKTLALALKKNDKTLIASVYGNMAICTRWQGDLTRASDYCRAALGYARGGLLLSTMADILAEQQHYDSAALVAKQALHLLKDDHHWYAGTLQILSKIALKQGQFKQAAAYGKQAMQVWQQYYPTSRQREKAKAQVQLGDVFLTAQQPTEALRYYQQALVLLLPDWRPAGIDALPAEEILYSENTLADALSGKAAAFTMMQQPREALANYMAAFMAQKKLRKEFYYAASKLKELEISRARVEAAMHLAFQLYRNTNDKQFADQLLLIAELSRAQVLMDERNARLQRPDSGAQKIKQLQNAIVYYQHELLNSGNKQQTSTLLQAAEYELSLLQKKLLFTDQQSSRLLTTQELSAIVKSLPPNVTALEFFAGRDSSYIIELTKEGVQSVRSSRAPHDSLQHFVQYWFANGPSKMMEEPRSFYTTAYAIYRALFAKYAWRKDRHYLLLPDGIFNYLPFDALLTDSSYQYNYSKWPYLCKQAILSQAYSLQTWHQQQTARYPSAPFTAFFVSKGKQAQQPALAMEEEYKALQQIKKGQYFLNEQATGETFRHAIDSAGILHISTHAISSAADAAPYLQLYDQPFYLFDLRYTHFSPALVVLGACKTADGVLMEGEGVNSISRGFTAAGGGGVVSGLWNVHDQAAIGILQSFYKQLSQQPNAAFALHQAKQSWLQQQHDNAFLHLPYYWAGFVYSGHLQKIETTAASAGQPYYWTIVLLAGLLTVGILVRRFIKRT